MKPITPLQQAAIDFVEANPYCTTSEVARVVGAAKTLELLGNLYARDLIARSPQRPGSPTNWRPLGMPERPTIEIAARAPSAKRVLEKKPKREPKPVVVRSPLTEAAIDEYWEAHPTLTRPAAERAIRRMWRQQA